MPDVAWPAARSAALWAFYRRPNAPEGCLTSHCQTLIRSESTHDLKSREGARGVQPRGQRERNLPGCAAPLYVSLRSGNVLTTKPGDPRQERNERFAFLLKFKCAAKNLKLISAAPRPKSILNFSAAKITLFLNHLVGNFIMQVVDIQAFSVMFAARSIPDFWSRIYRGILSPLREIL